MSLNHYIATDEEGNVVGKWVRNDGPTVEGFDVEQVSDIDDYEIHYLWFEQS